MRCFFSAGVVRGLKGYPVCQNVRKKNKSNGGSPGVHQNSQKKKKEYSGVHPSGVYTNTTKFSKKEEIAQLWQYNRGNYTTPTILSKKNYEKVTKEHNSLCFFFETGSLIPP